MNRMNIACYDDTMTIFSRFRACSALLALPAALLWLSGSASAQTVVELEVEGGIGAATAEYVVAGIEHAEETGAGLVVIRMDTPGGLVGAMRDIVSKILNSDVPIATYVSPEGARQIVRELGGAGFALYIDQPMNESDAQDFLPLLQQEDRLLAV